MKYQIIYQNTRIEAPDGEFLIGRDGKCNLVLDDPSVSRVHAAIICDNGNLYAEDRGSTNGIKVNNVRAGERVLLKAGDEIAIGHQRISIQGQTRSKDGERTVDGMDLSGKRTGGDTIAVQQPIPMRASLASKAIYLSKLDEAERLLSDAVDLFFKKQRSGTPVSDEDFNAIAEVIMQLSNASKSAAQISLLFSFHRAADRLMTRDMVEALYQLVRPAGYRACSELSRYLAALDLRAGAFSPGEKFIFKRLEGLVKICS